MDGCNAYPRRTPHPRCCTGDRWVEDNYEARPRHISEREIGRGTAARVGGAESVAERGATVAAQWGAVQVVELTDGVRLSAVMRPSPLQIAERMAALLTATMAFARREAVADVPTDILAWCMYRLVSISCASKGCSRRRGIRVVHRPVQNVEERSAKRTKAAHKAAARGTSSDAAACASGQWTPAAPCRRACGRACETRAGAQRPLLLDSYRALRVAQLALRSAVRRRLEASLGCTWQRALS